jgi:hypothetical protein
MAVPLNVQPFSPKSEPLSGTAFRFPVSTFKNVNLHGTCNQTIKATRDRGCVSARRP